MAGFEKTELTTTTANNGTAVRAGRLDIGIANGLYHNLPAFFVAENEKKDIGESFPRNGEEL